MRPPDEKAVGRQRGEPGRVKSDLVQMNDPGPLEGALFLQQLEPFGEAEVIKSPVRQPHHPGGCSNVVGRKGVVQAERDACMLKLLAGETGPRWKP